MEQRSQGRPVKGTRTNCRAQPHPEGAAGHTPLPSVALIPVTHPSGLHTAGLSAHPTHAAPLLYLGGLCPIWSGRLDRRWANKSDSICLISYFIDKEAGAQGGDKILMGITAPLSNLTTACASLSQGGCLFPPWLSLCLSYSSRDGMNRAAGMGGHLPSQPTLVIHEVTGATVNYPPHPEIEAPGHLVFRSVRRIFWQVMGMVRRP